MTISFSQWVKDIQADVEKALSNNLPSETESQKQLQQLNSAMRYAVLNGGKRIRPLLVHATGQLFGAPYHDAMQTACAVEMIHAYSLIHDDMPCMDNDTLRRGKPTVHVQYGEAMALLAGDALQSQAFSVMSNIESDYSLTIQRIRTLAQAAGPLGMCGGQAIDLVSVGSSLTRKELEQMDSLKTGALLKASVLLGALSGRQPSEQEQAALETYADAIGLAFQVVDDILDVTSDTAELGKTAGKDARDDKPTYVSLLGLKASQELAENLCKQAHTSLEQFGDKAQRLHEIADLIVDRKK